MRSALLIASAALVSACTGGGPYAPSSASYTAEHKGDIVRRADPEAPIVLGSEIDIRAVQARLAELNFYPGRVNGIWGSEAQAAVEEFQRAQGLPVGPLTRATLNAMGLETVPLTHSGPVVATGGLAGLPSDVAAAPGEIRVGAVLDSEGGVTAARPRAPAAAPSTGAARIVSPSELSRSEVSDVQARLSDQGLYFGDIDGIWGPLSRQALVDFQRRNNLPADGRIDTRTAGALGLDLQRLGTAGVAGGLRRIGPSGTTTGDVRPPSPSMELTPAAPLRP